MSSTSAFHVELITTTSAHERSRLQDLIERSPDVISEHKALGLAASRTQRHVGVRQENQFVAAAIVAPHGDVWNVELIAHSNSEHARMVAFDAAMVDLDGEVVQLWEPSTGLSVELEEAISRYDVDDTRSLLHLTRDLTLHQPEFSQLEFSQLGVRTFAIERDGEAFITANNLAFADHKEQGAWTASTLNERIAQPWFDSSVFLVSGEASVSGWCWCKIDPSHGEGHGEIYVIGTSPSAQGQGLGRKMLELGCAAMATRGVTHVDLYVDGDNTAALALYERAHFVETSRRRSWLFS